MANDDVENRGRSILGLPANEVAGLSADELTDNPTAIKMLLHYYRQLVDEKVSLRNQRNTLQTYATAYERTRLNTSVGAVLLTVSNVSVGFGVNLITSGQSGPGISSLVVGACLVVVGIFFSFRKN